jgi:inner membrane protein
MVWWLWVLVGVALLAVEIVVPGGFFVFFFGVAAVLVGLAVAAGTADAAWLQWLLFSVLSIGSLLLFRGPLLARLWRASADTADAESYVGEVAMLSDDLPAGAVGKAELRGTSWNVRSESATALVRGQRCRVTRVEGLLLWVRPEEA